MEPSHTMTVSELKNKLLEVVRRVEKGEVFEITKDGTPVAVLAPRETWGRKATGFGRVIVEADLDLSAEEWTHDVENLKRSPRRRK